RPVECFADELVPRHAAEAEVALGQRLIGRTDAGLQHAHARPSRPRLGRRQIGAHRGLSGIEGETAPRGRLPASMSESAAKPAGERRERLPAIDWLRGLAMALMAVDHCDEAWNRRHFAGDSAVMPSPRALPAAEFLTRWCTHFCAPTFVFLAGAGLALSAANAQRRGDSPQSIDRHLVLPRLLLIPLQATPVS